uniref:Uncharacterized protein n=1 Tax=Oryza barthii TaxID=65489 RepID=A0A0D3H141_9ORYZ
MTRRSGGGGARARTAGSDWGGETTRSGGGARAVAGDERASCQRPLALSLAPAYPLAARWRHLALSPPAHSLGSPPSPLLVPAHALPRPAAITSPFLRKWRRGEDRTDGWVELLLVKAYLRSMWS